MNPATFSVLVVSLTLSLVANAQSLLQNGNFESPISPWKVFSMPDTPETRKSSGPGGLVISAVGSSEKPANRQLMQSVLLESGKNYVLKFEVKGDLEEGDEMNVVIVDSEPGQGHFGLWKKLKLSPEWVSHALKFTAKDIPEGKLPVLKFHLGLLQGDIFFRNASLEQAD